MGLSIQKLSFLTTVISKHKLTCNSTDNNNIKGMEKDNFSRLNNDRYNTYADKLFDQIVITATEA